MPIQNTGGRFLSAGLQHEVFSQPFDGDAAVQPTIGLDVAQFLWTFTRAAKPRRALDIGTCLGYSAYVLAQCVGESGRVVTLEKEDELYREATRRLAKSGVKPRVQTILADADEWLRDSNETFDLILLDAAKAQYETLLPLCVDHMNPRGILVSDDAGFETRQFPEHLKHYSNSMKRYLDALAGRSELTSVYLPIGDGIVVSCRE